MKKKASKKNKVVAKKIAHGSFGVKPLADRVIVKEEEKDEVKKTDTGILVPNSNEKDANSRRGEVVAVGPGRYGDDNELLPMTLKVGDKVVFQWGEKMRIDGVEYYIVREGDILGIIG